MSAVLAAVLANLPYQAEASTSDRVWTYQAEVLISSITLTGKLDVQAISDAPRGSELVLEGIQGLRSDGEFTISGFYNGALASGEASFTGLQSIDSRTGRVIFSDVNLTLYLTTCEGMGDEAQHLLWNHVVTEVTSQSGVESWPDTYSIGETWGITETVRTAVDGRYYDHELISYERIDERTSNWTGIGSDEITVGREFYLCEIILCVGTTGTVMEWRNTSATLPLRVASESYDVPVYHSGETWNLLMVSSGGSCGCTGTETVYVGVGAGLLLGAVATVFFALHPSRRGA